MMRIFEGWFVVVLLLISSILLVQSVGASNEAYVTLLYGDEFVLGVRVLGKSIRDTKSTKDMVVLVSDGVSDYSNHLLKVINIFLSCSKLLVLVLHGVFYIYKYMMVFQADGWIVEKISLLANPNQVRPTRFWGVYTKLKIFNMTNYKKGSDVTLIYIYSNIIHFSHLMRFLAVVYLDADTILVQSIEDLFKCGKFCANLKHSERLNSGVMVVQPSQPLFNDMMSKVTTLESYTGGMYTLSHSIFAFFQVDKNPN